MAISILVIALMIMLLYGLWGSPITNYKWYRKYKGGIWYRYFPKMFPYMSFWTQDKDSLYDHEVIDKIEDYTK